MPDALRDHGELVTDLGQVYKQLNASVGSFGLDTLAASTTGLLSGSSTDDSAYQRMEAALTRLGEQRDDVAGQIGSMLWKAAFSGRAIDAHKGSELLDQAQRVLREAAELKH